MKYKGNDKKRDRASYLVLKAEILIDKAMAVSPDKSAIAAMRAAIKLLGTEVRGLPIENL